MAEFKISRFRYTWQGQWQSGSTLYNRDDIVLYDGKSWVCIRQHNSSSFEADQTYTPPGNTLPDPAWVKMTDGRNFEGEWTSTTLYEPGNLVKAGGNVYLCLTSHTSSSYFANDILKWEIFAVGSNFKGDWTPSYNKYQVGDVVRYNGYVYQCVLEHSSSTSSNGIGVGTNDGNDDSTAETWQVVVENVEYRGTFATSTRYRLNDLVKYGGSILKCIDEHTSSATPGLIDNTKWTTQFSGFNYSNAWSNSAYYAIGDVVRYGGTIYVAATNNINSQPGVSSLNPTGNSNWTKINRATEFLGPYTINTSYKQGEMVRRGGSLWVSLTDMLLEDDSTLETFDTSNWEQIIPAQGFRGTWNNDVLYQIGDLIFYNGSTYIANTPHLSSIFNAPGDNGEGIVYWDLAVQGDTNAVMGDLGDLLTYNLSRSPVGDGSTFGPTPIPIGDTDELLTVQDNNGTLGYSVWGEIQRVFYVRKDGVDDASDVNRGTNYFKPFKTIRYALEQADDGYSGFTSIRVSTGEYQEILPLIVPKRTAIIGEELRSVTIRANQPIEALANDATYTLAAITKISLIIDDIILGNPVTPGPTNTADIIGQSVSPTGNNTTAATVDSLLGNIISKIEYIINDFVGTNPAVSGSNTATTDNHILNTRTIIENNRTFLINEAIDYVTGLYPSVVYDTDKCRRDLNLFIDAIRYDLLYSGNYKSVLAARYYGNAVHGSAHEDMFYVRDATGLRNVTLKGLVGTLPAPTPGNLYATPTGGAYVSLDPGWGPADQRTWITTRSCYVQNVTTFGTGAIGQKIDGSLHSGGNKSIVSNDFTQVISDGIGAWVKDGGRAELVSVFTYYAHIGMYATAGGIIRATNGNSSYGDFGAVAEGLDNSETVRYAKVNTRTEQAIIDSAFAGEINDYILLMEFLNAGQEYTTASYSIQSSGYGASLLQEEFRDNAVFETQVLDGGGDFILVGNQAQIGDQYTITLASNESVTEAQILGMRLIIISGEGTGQYGYVYAYNAGTKVCTVYRESDNQPGWDNVVPGTLPNPLLTTGTRYRIEPRPTFSEPTFTATSAGFGSAAVGWSAAAYGETSETYSSITGTAGTGVTVDVTPAQAVFQVVKAGRTYTVTLTDGGAGYAVDDTITIAGGDVGGITDENDIVITVTAISDDSTNSITAFSVVGTAIASSGNFILTPSTGSTTGYSSDGEIWTFSNNSLPSSGNWKCLAAGNNKFVTIKTSSNEAAVSTDGITWTATTMPSSRDWNGVAYGAPSTSTDKIFLAVAGNLNSGAYSTNGTTWTATTLPTFGDSTLNEWVDVTFGKNKFVALANSNNIAAVGTWNGSGFTWQGTIMDAVADSASKDWVSIAYGNQRFVAISSTGDVAYSFDGLDWQPATLPTQDGSTAHNWKQIRYGQGVFFAVGDTGSRTVGADVTTGPTTFAATSYDGIVWTSRTLSQELSWSCVAFGNPDITLGDSTVSNSKPTWVIAPSTANANVEKVYTGARALGRVVVESGQVGKIRLWEPGSGYTSDPTLTITDPNKSENPSFRFRIADGVLAQPTFLARGQAYKTSTTYVTISGDGFADVTPATKFITVDNLTLMPGPGAQLYIGGRTSYFTAVIVDIDTTTQPDGTMMSTFQISPIPTLADNLEHDMEVVIREKYSQVRITGHDFLDVGTGNFTETNYPELYADYNFTNEPLQEVYSKNGGRVFYTSTDQDGNYRAGDLFAVEQATGIITISADFFDLAGLTELRLGGVRVGSTAVIREFSKDPLFLQNSNNIVPTQRAIRSYLQSRLNIGGEDLLTPSITAGTVQVGPNLVDNTADLTIDIPVIADFTGSAAGISGSMLAQTMFFRSFKDDE